MVNLEAVQHANGLLQADTSGPKEMASCRFFELKYHRTLVHGDEVLCKELCLVSKSS